MDALNTPIDLRCIFQAILMDWACIRESESGGKDGGGKEVTWGAPASWWDSTWPPRHTIQSRVTTVGLLSVCVCAVELISSVMTAPVRLAPMPPLPPPQFPLYPWHTHATIAATNPTTYTHTYSAHHRENGSHWCYVLGGCGGGGVHSEALLLLLHLPYTKCSTKSFFADHFSDKSLVFGEKSLKWF